MFKIAGEFKGKVLETMIAEPKFSKDPNAVDVCLRIEGPNAPDGSPQVDWWRGEMSAKVATSGTVAGMSQAAITMQNLGKIGFVGNDISQLDAQILGKEVEFTVVEREYNDNKYYDIKYLGGSDFAPKKLDAAEAARRMMALTGVAPAAAPAPVAQPAAAVPPAAAPAAQVAPAMPPPAAAPATQVAAAPVAQPAAAVPPAAAPAPAAW